MICKPCKKAGKLLVKLDPADPDYEWLLDDVRAYHGKCKAPTTCPCQHKTKRFDA